jgi:hypothetical protein
MGTIVQVSISAGGVPKHAIGEGTLATNGIVGDAWRYPFHGGPKRAILLITSEGIDSLAAQGFPVYYGALGENLTNAWPGPPFASAWPTLPRRPGHHRTDASASSLRHAECVRNRNPSRAVRCSRAGWRRGIAGLGNEWILRVGCRAWHLTAGRSDRFAGVTTHEKAKPATARSSGGLLPRRGTSGTCATRTGVN